MTLPGSVLSGLDVLLKQSFAPLKGLRVGLVTHAAAVDRNLRNARELFAQSSALRLAALFGPEHGLLATAQDLIGVAAERDPLLGLPTYSLYGATVDSLRPTAEQLVGLDALVIDMQDVGSRYYTFQATMLYCFEEAAKHKLLTVVLDRPNPIGGVDVEGPVLQEKFSSFVGAHPMPTRHGLTVGELAQLYKRERHIDGELLVIPCEGLRRDMDFDDTGLPWVLPSPNMPTVDTAFVYPGQCLLEGTNLSEGRGLTRPFEICGAPGVDPREVCDRLGGEELAGVVFRPCWFQPTFHKFSGKPCGGIQLHVLDRRSFQPVRAGLAVLAAFREAWKQSFRWREETYEFVSDRLAIDLLFGSDKERLALESGTDPKEIAKGWEDEEESFRRRRREFLIYT